MLREKLHLASLNPLSDHIWSMEISYMKPKNQNVQNKLEKVQYKACLAASGAIQATRRQKNLRFKFKSSINC